MNLTYQPYFGKTIIFCLPGSHYSGRFLVSFTELILACKQVGMNPIISQDYSSMVNFARCKVAGANVTLGKHQAPFGGKIDYDYMMWIDSDIVFKTNDFFKLLNMNKDIASGWYTQPGGSTPVVEKMDDEHFKKYGSYQFISSKEMKERTSVFKADYIGFGWVLVKHGVFESIDYPWFAPKMLQFDENTFEMCSEDVSFCIDARKMGYNIWVDPTIKLGHEKIQVL